MAYPDNTVVEVRLVYECNGQTLMNVTHWDPDNNGAGATPFELSELLADFITTQPAPGLFQTMLAMMAQNVTFTRIDCQAIWPTRYRAYSLGLNNPGQIAADCEAQNLQAAIEKVGEIANRHNLGSFHLGGLPATSYNNGELTAGTLTALDLVAEALKTPLVVAGPPAVTYSPVILNKEKVIIDGKPKYNIIGWSPVFTTIAKEELRCMTRRTVGRGI